MQITPRIRKAYLRLETDLRLARLAREVAVHAPQPQGAPVAFFNVSSRLGSVSLNAAFTTLTAWAAQLAGAPVVHFACDSGMPHCVLGTNPDDPAQPPPCDVCVARTRTLAAPAPVHWFEYQPDEALEAAMEGLGMAELSEFVFETTDDGRRTADSGQWSVGGGYLTGIPLGSLVLPSLRWALRRHHLPDDEPTRALMRDFIRAAYRVAVAFDRFLQETRPRVVVLFNGLQFPEATARWVARRRGVRTITHEVSFQPFSAFFTEGEATAYPIDIPADFDLSPAQNARLDAWLSKRFRGDFTMAGIRFWPEMNGLDDDFLARAAQFEAVVPVFTNVVFDTSQLHANTVFPHMFAWLDTILEVIRAHPETLFVIRAHPDEKRPGTRKRSREAVSDWVARNGVDRLPNVVFIDALEYISSYDLIRRAKFVMVYNSSIGLEAILLGTPVLCGGKARYTQYPIVTFPQSPGAYRAQAEAWLAADEIPLLPDAQRNARRFLYYQLFRVSLPFDAYLEAHPTPGYVRLKRFSWRDLHPQNAPVMRVIVGGILENHPFLLPNDNHKVHEG
ncbi:MAG: hypothetical protein D6803_08195 [Anaerolineae bacterium]|nr:MAG: hypothetical protein D6803_08195 [Anaerolineae bacterium]